MSKRDVYTRLVSSARSVDGAQRDSSPSTADVERVVTAALATRSAVQMSTGHRSAVLILLFDRGGAPHIALTRRPDDIAHHPGQVCLPGGRHEPSDAHLEDTALRETHEEIGIPTRLVRVLGALDDVSTLASGFTITPFIGVLSGAFRPTPNALEIACLHEVPLEDVLAAHRSLPAVPTAATLRYALGGEDVWGATARILRQFCELLEGALAVRTTE